MTTLAYLHYDVFTDRPLSGNQLAVFPDAQALATADMQAIAREMNFSESAFILPAERDATDVRMRIFTPHVEMPMAGHPTIGATFALAQQGAISPVRSRFVFGLNIGPTPVDLEWRDGHLAFAWMTQRLPSFGVPVQDRASVAEALGLRVDDLLPHVPVQEVSCGVPFIYVPLRDRAAVDRAESDKTGFRRLRDVTGEDRAVFLFAVDPAGSPDTAYSRMFAPQLGIAEDPATGGASGPLGCYLVRHGLVPDDASRRIVSAQGVAMGRASRIHIAIATSGGEITGVQVGGVAVLVGRGELFL